MPKRSYQSDEQDEHTSKRARASGTDSLSKLSDELLLRVLSYLTVHELIISQRISHRFNSIASDSQLWKAHYYNRFVLPRAARLPSIRAADSATATSNLTFSSKRSKWLDEETLVRKGNETNWKRQYKLRHNWSEGTCRVSEVQVVEQAAMPPVLAPLLVRMHEGVVYTVDSNGGLRAWATRGKPRMIAEGRLPDGSPSATSLAVNVQPSATAIRLAVGFLDGSFRVFKIDAPKSTFTELYSHAASTNGMLTGLAYSSPYLLTMTSAQLLSVYKFPSEPRDVQGSEILDPPRLLQSLRAHTIYPPAYLSIRHTAEGINASIAYTFSTVLSNGWSVGIQEMRLSADGALVSSRVANASIDHGSAPALPLTRSILIASNPSMVADRPTSLCYAHPYMLVSHANNTMSLYLVRSDNENLTISAGRRLCGHTSGISGAFVGERGKAVSVSKVGNELRVWELESALKAPRLPWAMRAQFASTLVVPDDGDARDALLPRDERATPSSVPGVAHISEAIRRRGDGLGLAWLDRFDVNRALVGFDEENVVVLREKPEGSQALVVYDFT